MTTWYFDMDGTLVDLYGVEHYSELLRMEKLDFFELKPLIDLKAFTEWAVKKVILEGDRIAIITWLPWGASDEYLEQCAAEKKEWIRVNLPFITEVVCLPYGMPKTNGITKRTSRMILIDDNLEVCEEWATDIKCCATLAQDFWKEIDVMLCSEVIEE